MTSHRLKVPADFSVPQDRIRQVFQLYSLESVCGDFELWKYYSQLYIDRELLKIRQLNKPKSERLIHLAGLEKCVGALRANINACKLREKEILSLKNT